MTTVNVQEAKTHLSRLLERVEQGERIVIARAGRAIAELAPLSRVEIVFGGMAGEFELDDEAFVAADADIAAMWDDEI